MSRKRHAPTFERATEALLDAKPKTSPPFFTGSGASQYIDKWTPTVTLADTERRDVAEVDELREVNRLISRQLVNQANTIRQLKTELARYRGEPEQNVYLDRKLMERDGIIKALRMKVEELQQTLDMVTR